jgi:hypothetical protein
MEGLGRLFNVLAVGDAVYVNLRDYGAVTFVGQLDAGDTFTVTEATALAGTGAQALATVTQYYTSAKAGTGAWTKHTQAAASTVVTADSSQVVFTVSEEELSDTYDYIKCASTSPGTVTVILHDPQVQRAPASLPAVSA